MPTAPYLSTTRWLGTLDSNGVGTCIKLLPSDLTVPA